MQEMIGGMFVVIVITFLGFFILYEAYKLNKE